MMCHAGRDATPAAAGDATPIAAWFELAFQQEYLDLYLHRDLAEAARAVRFLARALALDNRHCLLDLCCGPGRHLTFLKERVGQAVGIDLSSLLLRRAQLHGREVHAEAEPHRAPRLVCADMRRLPLADAAFDRIVNLFTSFGYFTDEAENLRVLAEVTRLLRPAGFAADGLPGRFAIDHIHRRRLLERFEPISERRMPSGTEVLEKREWIARSSRVVKRVTVSRPGGPVKQWTESVRVYEPEELEELLHRAGLEPLSRYGDYDGAPWSADAERLILIAQRRI